MNYRHACFHAFYSHRNFNKDCLSANESDAGCRNIILTLVRACLRWSWREGYGFSTKMSSGFTLFRPGRIFTSPVLLPLSFGYYIIARERKRKRKKNEKKELHIARRLTDYY